MNNFTSICSEKVKNSLLKYNMLSSVKTLVVGFSGGADSICLLHILNSLKYNFEFNLIAVHVNHGIRGDEAKRDQNFCLRFCEENNIVFKTVHIDCIKESKETKESLELCARRMRYDVLNSFCDVDSKIVTAHNANDNAETVLFNLSRGSALKGVTGIPYVRDNIIRPLLDCSRLEIEEYCRENNLLFVTDSTNLQNEYSRNKIRHNVIPQLEEVNQSTVNNINSFSHIAAEVSDFLSAQTKKLLIDSYLSGDSYKADILKESHNALLKEFIVLSFSKFSKICLDRNKINNILEVIKNGGRIQLFGNMYVENVKNTFRYFNKTEKQNSDEIFVGKINETYKFNYFSISLEDFTDNLKFVNKKDLDNFIDYDKINGNLFFRCRQEGDTFCGRLRNGTKTLKKLFNENNIPVEIRGSLPILCDDSGIVWVYSIGVSKRCCVDENSIHIVSMKGENNG